MEWKVLAALSMLGLALIAGFVICIATSVNLYAKKLAESPEKREQRRRGFEVSLSDPKVAGQSEKDKTGPRQSL